MERCGHPSQWKSEPSQASHGRKWEYWPKSLCWFLCDPRTWEKAGHQPAMNWKEGTNRQAINSPPASPK